MKRQPKFPRYRDSDGGILRVNLDVMPRLVGAMNGHNQVMFYMYPAIKDGERCEVSSATLGVLQEIGPHRRKRERGPARKKG
jgi:hypothetical protein